MSEYSLIRKKEVSVGRKKKVFQRILCTFRYSGFWNLCYILSHTVHILYILCKKWENHSQTSSAQLVVTSLFLRHQIKRSQHFVPCKPWIDCQTLLVSFGGLTFVYVKSLLRKFFVFLVFFPAWSGRHTLFSFPAILFTCLESALL